MALDRSFFIGGRELKRSEAKIFSLIVALFPCPFFLQPWLFFEDKNCKLRKLLVFNDSIFLGRDEGLWGDFGCDSEVGVRWLPRKELK